MGTYSRFPQAEPKLGSQGKETPMVLYLNLSILRSGFQSNRYRRHKGTSSVTRKSHQCHKKKREIDGSRFRLQALTVRFTEWFWVRFWFPQASSVIKNILEIKGNLRGFSGGSAVKYACSAQDAANAGWGSIPELGSSPGEGNGNPLQYLAWEIPRTEHLAGYTVQGVAKHSTGSNQLGTQGDLTTDCLLHEL